MAQTKNLERFFQNNLDDADFIFDNNKTEFYLFERDDQIDFPYNEGFYRISLIKGAFKFNFADELIETGENTLLFVTPENPVEWEPNDGQSGCCCIFKRDLFSAAGFTWDSLPFPSAGVPAFNVASEELAGLINIYFKMSIELDSGLVYKFDVLRALVMELTYAVKKKEPLGKKPVNESNASQRIVNHFMELLEQQFPITAARERMKIRFAVDFADHLAVHVNHLNRALKETIGNTTTQSIAHRLLKEAQRLLKDTDWNISEISWCLGFEELPHFINFFKKSTGITPKAFRQQHSNFNAIKVGINPAKNG